MAWSPLIRLDNVRCSAAKNRRAFLFVNEAVSIFCFIIGKPKKHRRLRLKSMFGPSILECFEDMGGGEFVGCFEVRDGARDLEHAMVAA